MPKCGTLVDLTHATGKERAYPIPQVLNTDVVVSRGPG
jgi:hypothetical protein